MINLRSPWMTGKTTYAASSLCRWTSTDDLTAKLSRQTFAQLEPWQEHFYIAAQCSIQGQYPWPLRPLYEWSRRAEYPFVVNQLPKNRSLRILDAGSGITFFSYYLQNSLGHEVVCLDSDERFAGWMQQLAAAANWHAPQYFYGDIAREETYTTLGLFDAVICVSVLEHLTTRDLQLQAVQQLWNAVSPGGRLILTIDVVLMGHIEGLPLYDVASFLQNVSEIVGPLPHLAEVPPENALTTLSPRFGLCSIIDRKADIHERVIAPPDAEVSKHRGIEPLPYFKGHLACLMVSIDKPKIGDENKRRRFVSGWL